MKMVQRVRKSRILVASNVHQLFQKIFVNLWLWLLFWILFSWLSFSELVQTFTDSKSKHLRNYPKFCAKWNLLTLCRPANWKEDSHQTDVVHCQGTRGGWREMMASA